MPEVAGLILGGSMHVFSSFSVEKNDSGAKVSLKWHRPRRKM